MSKVPDFVLEYSKIFINLTSLFLALSITFVDKIAGKDAINLLLLIGAWGAWIVSIFFGSKAAKLLVNIVIVSEEDDTDHDVELSVNPDDTVFSKKLKFNLDWQVWMFVVGVIFVMSISALEIISKISAIPNPA